MACCNPMRVKRLQFVLFFIDPAKKIRLIMYYPLNVGRNMDEILRALQALQFSDKHKVAMPLNWKKGEK